MNTFTAAIEQHQPHHPPRRDQPHQPFHPQGLDQAGHYHQSSAGKLAIDYKADLSKPENRLPKLANDDKPSRKRFAWWRHGTPDPGCHCLWSQDELPKFDRSSPARHRKTFRSCR
jgi:hypothetical protein